MSKAEMVKVLQELEDIQIELDILKDRADYLLRQVPEHIREQSKAYACTQFGTSDNPYDITFDKIVRQVKIHIDKMDIEEEEDE